MADLLERYQAEVWDIDQIYENKDLAHDVFYRKLIKSGKLIEFGEYKTAKTAKEDIIRFGKLELERMGRIIQEINSVKAKVVRDGLLKGLESILRLAMGRNIEIKDIQAQSRDKTLITAIHPEFQPIKVLVPTYFEERRIAA